MDVSGKTLPYAVLGHPIGHSLSPAMHNASLNALGKDAIYLAFDVHPDNLMQVLPAMGKMGFGGVNLTVPLKEVACPGIDHLEHSARLLGAVNTVAFAEGGLTGHNTDGYGFLKAVEEAFDIDVADKSVFILGCGGAGRAVALTCADNRAKSIVLSDIDSKRTGRLRKEIEEMHCETEILIAENSKDQIQMCSRCELVVQASPVGMQEDDPAPLPEKAFTEGQYVFDLIYMYPQTKLMAIAGTAGARVANGLGMLLHQGARSYGIWTGEQPETEAMRSALEEAVYSK